jgi:hypothetical protein
METRDQKAAAIWKQKTIPVVYRVGSGIPLMIKLPFSPDNRKWLRGENRRKPNWIKQFKCWQTPNSWFDDVVRRLLDRFAKVYVIQPYRVMEKCAPACWNARGFVCECSCMGANHGSQAPGNWFIISETCALSWRSRELACRLIEKPAPTNVLPNP